MNYPSVAANMYTEATSLCVYARAEAMAAIDTEWRLHPRPTLASVSGLAEFVEDIVAGTPAGSPTPLCSPTRVRECTV